MSVTADVRALAQPNHPARLLAIFAATAAACALVAAAALAVAYIVGEETAGDAPPGARAGVDAPDGLVVVIPVVDAAAFEGLAGFAPLEAAWLPPGTKSASVYSVTPPDEDGRREGRVSYGERDGVSNEGIHGPAIVLVQSEKAPPPGADGTLQRLTAGSGRTLVARFACGDLAIEAQIYFTPAPAPGEDIVTPYMRDTAQRFVDELRSRCG